MGTPALPDLGKHCSVDDCRQIDFLPFTCDCCRKVFCLEHRSYYRHHCPKANKNDVTVVVCPLCAKGVHLIPDEDPNVTWESHVNTDCDPSNYEKSTKKRKCPLPGCRELLTFSNTIKCRECSVDHCLKHRFGPDHKCPGPRKPERAFSFMSYSNKSKNDETKHVPATSSSRWTTSFLEAASSVRARAGAGMAKLSSDFNQAIQKGKDRGSLNSRATTREGGNASGSISGKVEQCPRCSMRFSSVMELVDHVENVHERKSVVNSTVVDICPRCRKGFCDPVSLVEHVEREHRNFPSV